MCWYVFEKVALFFALSFFPAAYASSQEAPPQAQNAPAEQGSSDSAEVRLQAALRREEELKAELDKYKRRSLEPEGPKDLRASVQKDFERQSQVQNQTKALEKALSFNMSVQSYVDGNKDILPHEIPAILKRAEQESYDSAEQKAAVLKEAMIQSFFSLQANKDLLTKHQAAMLDDFVKLTKNGREAKAADIFENVFEPAVELVRRVKKAEELSRARHGYAPISDVMEDYKQRLIERWNQKHKRTRAV